ncbi:hypothetical protein [Magnetococcus sp. PR-3]|uniref:hypothetical protein n=1 Tax=Magnetococcus sp. PR-3 TaxID=3120355 RepID=UPI002FCE27C8
MSELREIPSAQTVEADGCLKQWFQGEDLDLFIWLQEGVLYRFQLAYDRQRVEHLLQWQRDQGLRHFIMDDGESNPLKNQSPIMLSGGAVPWAHVIEKFEKASQTLNQPWVIKIIAVLKQGG